MSAPVDVLAALDTALEYAANSDHEDAAQEFRDLQQARSAVAELIAAAEFVADNAATDSPDMWARLDAALARVGAP